jgi:hypothetical protein
MDHEPELTQYTHHDASMVTNRPNRSLKVNMVVYRTARGRVGSGENRRVAADVWTVRKPLYLTRVPVTAYNGLTCRYAG